MTYDAYFGNGQQWDVSALPKGWSRTLSLEIGLNVRDLAKNFLVEIAILQSRTLKERARRPIWTSAWFLAEIIVNHGIVT